MQKLIGLLVVLLCFCTSAYGQRILGPRQTGVIQDLVGNGPDTLTISGVVYDYGSRTEVYIRGERISETELEVGMVVRFVAEEGSLQQVEILGPNNLIENLAPAGILD